MGREAGNDEAFAGLGRPDAVSTAENLAVVPTPDRTAFTAAWQRSGDLAAARGTC